MNYDKLIKVILTEMAIEKDSDIIHLSEQGVITFYLYPNMGLANPLTPFLISHKTVY